MSHRVYELRRNRKRFAYFGLQPEAATANSLKLMDGGVKGTDWQPPPIYVPYPTREPWDIALFVLADALVMNERATDALSREFFDFGGAQLLPFAFEGNRYHIVNVTELPNCLDKTTSIIAPDGTVEKYSFFPKRFTKSLFKLPQRPCAAPFVAEDDDRPTWSFKQAVERHDLKGLEFSLLWEENMKNGIAKGKLELKTINVSPSAFRAVQVGPESIVFQWEHPANGVDYFLLEWSRDAKRFTPVDEIKPTPLGAIVGGGNRTFTFEETLPVSGVSYYRVKAVFQKDKLRSDSSEIVSVSIQGPARGDP